jgi:serine/threonine-protein kinase RsbW
MAQVELLLAPLPAHVRTARLVAVAAARRAGLADELVDELRLAIGEATTRAVGLHALHAPAEPVRVTVSDDAGGVTVTVTDVGPAAGPAPVNLAEGLLEAPDAAGDPIHPDVALAVVTGLVDSATVEPTDGGTTVTMRWPLPPNLPGRASTAAAQA